MRFASLMLLLSTLGVAGQSWGDGALRGEYRLLRETIGRRAFDEAVVLCRGLIDRYPHHMPLYETLGEIHQYSGSLPEGVMFLEGRIVDGTAISLAYFGLGNIYYCMQDDRRAIQHLERAIELGLEHPDCHKLLEYSYERLEGVDNTIRTFTVLSHRYPENANHWYALALAYWGKEDYANSRVYLEEAICRRPAEVRYQQALAALNLRSLGRPEDEAAVRRLLGTARFQEDIPAAAHLSASLVQYLVSKGILREAEDESRQSLSETDRYGYLRWNSWANLKVADLSFFGGLIQQAIPYLNESIICGLLSSSTTATRDAFERHFESLLELGSLGGALASLEMRIEYLGPRLPDRERAKACLDMCRLTNEVGDFQAGLDFGSQALSWAEGAKADSSLIAQIHTGLAMAFLGLEKVDEAKRHFEATVRWFPRDAFYVKASSVAAGNFGDLALEGGMLREAMIEFENQKELAISSGFRRELGMAEANLGRVLELAGRRASAHQLFERGYQIGKGCQSAHLVAQCVKGLARTSRELGKTEQSIRWHFESIGIADSMAILLENSKLYPDYGALISLLNKRERRSEAFLVSDRSKAYAHRSSIFATLAQLSMDSALDGGIAELPREERFTRNSSRPGSVIPIIHGLGDPGTREDVKLSASRAHRFGHGRSAYSSMEYQMSAEGSNTFLRDVRSLIADSSLLIEFARTGSEWVMFVVSRESLCVVETGVGVSQMDSLIERCSRIFDDELADQRVWNAALAQFDCGALADLYSVTLGLVRQRFPESHRFVIVSEGPFRKVPFECLVVETGANKAGSDFSRVRFLIEDCIITYLPTATSLALPGDRQDVSTNRFLLAVGGMATPESRMTLDPLIRRLHERQSSGRQSSLPGSVIEIERLSEMLRARSTVLEGDEATKEKILEEGPRHQVIHLATHVGRDMQDSWQMGLAVSSSRSQLGDVLTLPDLLEMSAGSKLVVLNGCSSNIPSRGATAGGFGAALLVSGVPAVVSTLWDIDDNVASELAIDFYAYLLEGIPSDQALRQAKLNLIRSGRSDPYHWAGFIFSGVSTVLSSDLRESGPAASSEEIGLGAGVGVFILLFVLARKSPEGSLLRMEWADRGAM